jgi:hypothetical protein
MEVSINAPDDQIAELQRRLQNDPDFIKSIAEDPSKALEPYGVTMDEHTEAAVKAHFESVVAPGPGPSPVSVAVGVAFAVAVAIP